MHSACRKYTRFLDFNQKYMCLLKYFAVLDEMSASCSLCCSLEDVYKNLTLRELNNVNLKTIET